MIESEQTSVGLEQVLGILRRRAPLIVLCLVLAAAAAYGYAKRQTKEYTATAAVTFSNDELSKQIAGLATSISNAAEEESNLELVRLGSTARVAQLVGRGLTAGKVSSSLSISGQKESSVVDVAATSTSPELAAAIANAYVGQFVKARKNADRAFFKSALAVVNGQLDQLSRAQRFSTAGVDLEDRAHTLSLLSQLGYSEVQVAGEATVPSSPSSPKVARDTGLGALIGLLLGIAVVLLLERFDRRIRKPNELESIYRLPLVGAVPDSKALAKASGGRGKAAVLPQVEAEAFSLIWAHLRFLNVDREIRSIVVASAEAGDGKTLIARHLAEAGARLGLRVLLVDADMRNPTLADQLGVKPGFGLADVLRGEAAADYAVQTVEFDAAPGEGAAGRVLSVLSAGSTLPANPGELLRSRAMTTTLEWTKRAGYDLVVIDTPPLSAVSDAFPLLSGVDGTLLVGRIGHSRRDAAKRVQRVLASSGVVLLGVIANGSRAGAPAPYPSAGQRLPPTSADERPSGEFVPATES
jgi:polysaccharide biosynthesis transport protein